jgi:N-acetylglutamate synthase-like GNAT family acetyltransferase
MKNIEEAYIRPGGCFALIEENNSILAMGALKIISEKEAEIKRMRVETFLQRQGLGQIILDYLLQNAKRKGIKAYNLDTSELQIAAQHFYIKNGFIEYKRNRWNNITIIFYEKFL